MFKGKKEKTAEAQRMFSFQWAGEEIEVTGAMLLQYLECAFNGEYYELPYSIDAHAKSYYSLLYLHHVLR